MFTEKVPKYLCHGHWIHLNCINERKLTQTQIALNKFLPNFDKEIFRIKEKFLVDYPQKFVESAIHNFENDNVESVEDDCINPRGCFDIGKPIIIVEVPFCTKNELSSKQFIGKFYNFTRSKFDLWVKWITRKMKTLFKLKDKCLHPACKIYIP